MKTKEELVEIMAETYVCCDCCDKNHIDRKFGELPKGTQEVILQNMICAFEALCEALPEPFTPKEDEDIGQYLLDERHDYYSKLKKMGE